MKKMYVVLFFAIGLLASTAVMADTLSECPVSKMLLKCPDMTMPDDSKRILLLFLMTIKCQFLKMSVLFRDILPQ